MSYSPNLIFVSFQADGYDQEQGVLVADNDPQLLRRMSHRVQRANETAKSWLYDVRGSAVKEGDACGIYEIPAENVGKVARFIEQYALALDGMTVSCGLGMAMDTAYKAMLVAHKRGGDRVLMWSDDLLEELDDECSEETSHGEESSALDDYRDGFTDEDERHQIYNSGVDLGTHQTWQNVVEKAEQEEKERPMSVEERLHEHAQRYEAAQKLNATPRRQWVKEKVVKILQNVVQQADQLEKLKELAPELHQLILGKIYALHLMAKELALEPANVEEMQDPDKVAEAEAAADEAAGTPKAPTDAKKN